MIIEKANYYGNPNIGIYIYANDKIALVPKDTEDKLIKLIKSVLNISTVVRISIADTNIINVFVVGNNKGILLPHIVKEHELSIIRQVFEKNVAVVKTRFTALGNVCLVNDRAALIYSQAYEELKNIIKEFLEVENVEKGVINDIPTVGSAAYVNNIGGLIHPDATEKDLEYLSNLFKVRVDIGTVNFGIGFIKSGLVGNSSGLLVGERTTGPEIMRISKVFGSG